MSLYYLQKVIYELNRDEKAREKFESDEDAFLAEFDLTEEEMGALKQPDVGLLYVLGVNGQLLMHYAAYKGLPWDDYIAAMRKGVEQHGPVRAGLYAMVRD